MRLFTKLWSTLLLLCVASVANAATEYEIDQKFTSVAALDGQLFAIVNETDAKAIYNKDNQNLAYDSYTNAVGGAAYLFKLHSLADAGIEQLENAYAIECVKADGSSQSVYGQTPIYLNSGAEGGFDGCFVLGNGTQYGTDCLYGGAWVIEYDATKGFALKSVARGGYFAGVNPAPTGEDPVYWTFCTLKAGAEIPDPEPEVIPEPDAPLAEGELIPDFFSICDEGGIPYGYDVKFGSENRAYPSTFTGGARIFNFGENGDFTKAIYFREGYIRYGNVKALALEAGKEYTVCFNSAMWKSSGATLVFSIFKEGDLENAVLTQTINNTPDVNGSKDAVSGSTRSEIKFTPEADGNYILEWNAEGWKEVLLANVAVKVAKTEESADFIAFDWIAGDQNYDNAQDLNGVEIALDAKTTMTCTTGTGKNGPKYYTTGSAIRTYGGNVITFKGEGITKIIITGVSGKVTELTANTGELSTDGIITTWKGEADEIILTNNTTNQQHIAKLHIVYGGLEADVEPIHIENTAETAYDIAKAIELIEAGDALNETVFIKGIISKIEKVNIDAEDGSKSFITYWISADGKEESQQFQCYKGLSMEGLALENIEVGAEVIVSGLLTKYRETYELNTGNIIVSYNLEESEKDYRLALKQIKANNFYQITTTVGETTYYLTGEGKLTADAEAATAFEFKAVNANGTFKSTGWNLGYKFTNPNMTGEGGTGDPKNEGYIRSDAKNDRDTYERQVFLFNGTNFAVRSTNATGTSWGANTYWDVIEGEELPTAGYALTSQYKWNLVDITLTQALKALQDEIAATNAIVESREGVGSGLFQKSETELATLADAATAAHRVAENAEATTEEIQEARAILAAANKAYASGGTMPKDDVKYTFQQKASGMYLALNESGVVLSADPYQLSWVAVEGGGWYLTDGELYVGLAGTNNWTMSSAADKKMVINPTLAEVEGVVYYTLNEAKGMIASDGTDAGAACYADKSVAKSGDKAYWTIAEWVAPVEPTEDYTAYIVNADLKSTEPAGFDATGTKGIDGSGIVKAGNNAVYDFKQTIAGLPAGKYVVSVQAAYRYGADEQAEAEAYFNDAIETKFAKLYATVGTKTVDVLVKNRYDGASDTDWANGEGSVMVMGKPVPNSSSAVKAWFDAKQYTNEVTFNLAEAGDVTIGIVKTAQPEAGDYTVIGPWTLTRIGDADEEEPEPQPQPGLIADGKYYFFNVATEQYLAAGADWGTHAVVNSDGVEYTVALADGKYTIDSQISNGGDNHYLNGEWNDGAAMGWTIAEVREGVYTLSNGEKFLTAQDNGVVTLQDDATAITAMWTLVTPEARLSELANATADAPVTATFLITDANFGRNDLRQSAWTIDAANKNLSGGNNTNNCAESFHSVFTLSQTLANAPKGVYALTAQGFYRQDGSDDENLPVFFANDETAKFPLKTGSENSMSDASNSFTNGAYTIDPIYVEINDGETLTIGAKLEGNTNLWCIWDNFQLTYYGTEANIEELRYAGLIAQLAELKNEATTFIDGGEVSAHTTIALQAAVRGADTVESSEESYNSAISALKEAIAQAKKDVVNKAAIDAMYALIESTNVYTAEALETYKRAADDYKAAFEEGTLTVTVDNPAALHGWRTNNDYDDLLLSAWTIDGVQASDFTTDLYINNWSVEGENDGSEFFVPFFEYWTGDGNSLAERTLAANMTNLPAGNYTISAWVRVRAKNGYTAPAYGITLSGNDGEAVDVAAGNQIGTSQFYINEYTANCVVGADGKLTIQFNIAADNNISWLSFKNVKFEKVSEVGVNGIAIDASNDAIYDLTGRRVKTPVKGSLYIINGNKKLVK